MNYSLTDNQIAKYMRILGVTKSAPSIGALNQIVKAHVTKIPFENISKLYYLNKMQLRYIPDAELYLNGIEEYNFGGTCYSNNYYLNLLLKSLGYDVKLCGADMNEPDVHMVNMVKIDGREYLIDSGNAAPFLESLPRDINEDIRIDAVSSLYILKPQDSEGKSMIELYRDGKKLHNYTAKPDPKSIKDFEYVIKDSFIPKSTFMNAILLTRFSENSSVIIHNYNLIKIDGESFSKKKLINKEELIYAIEEYFGIPPDISELSISGIQKFKDVWG